MLFANNCNTTLSGSLTNVATTMSVTSATGFPSPTGSQYFYCTLADAATQTTIEIVKVTAVSGTTFTIVRGQDGTSGTAFASGAVVSLRLVRASLNDFPKLDEANTFTQLQTINTIGVSGSTSTTPVLSFNASNCPIASGTAISGSYLQFVLQNTSGTIGASTNYVLSNDLGTDSSYYGEFGMNSSVYSSGTPADFFSINNGIYFSGHDGDITVGSGNGKKLYFAWGTSGGSAHVINASGAIGLNTNLASGTGSGTTNFGTAGQPLLSGGSSATPTWGTLGVAGGGTGLTSLTAKYIPYGNGTGAFSSSASFNFDGTKMGIGTSAPNSQLEVNGGILATGSVTLNTSSLGLNIGNAASAQTGSVTGFVVADAGGYGGYNDLIIGPRSDTGNFGNIRFYTGNAERSRIFSSGGVSIGNTTDPGAGSLLVQTKACIATSGSGLGYQTPLLVKGGGLDGQQSTGVSTTATTIYTFPGNATGGLVVVLGDNGSNGFLDIISTFAGVVSVISSQNSYGSPGTRTYTCPSGLTLKLALSSGSVTCRTAVLAAFS